MNTKKKYIVIALSVGILMVTACKKDSNLLPIKMSATIDGQAWNSSIQVTARNNTGFVITGTQVSTSLVTSTLLIRINGFTTGTYSVVAISNNCLATYTPNIDNATSSFFSATGTVNLTEVNASDKTISGTFEFNCFDSAPKLVTITKGSFTQLKYQEKTSE
jgi:hypothetical protein